MATIVQDATVESPPDVEPELHELVSARSMADVLAELDGEVHAYFEFWRIVEEEDR